MRDCGAKGARKRERENQMRREKVMEEYEERDKAVRRKMIAAEKQQEKWSLEVFRDSG